MCYMLIMDDLTLRRPHSVYNVAGTHFRDEVGCPPFEEEREMITQDR